MKILKKIWKDALFLLTIFLIAFIPLYPKIPLVGVSHTWVYIRFEDVFVALSLIIWFIFLIRKKVSFRTPLTLPIIIFWLVGLISTLNALFFIFPHLANVFPNVAILNYLRRIEYISVFFIAYFAINSEKKVKITILVLALTMFAIFLYGWGQRLLGFPAYLTMNEEFAKGIPLRLSPLSRVPSTFAGHYDLAAYLILMIPILGSMFFGFKKYYLKILLLLVSLSGLILLLMTASRVSFIVYLVSVVILLIFQKQKKWIIPVIIASILIMNSFNGISSRFASTISQVDLVVDARTGKPVGIATNTGQNVVIQEKQSTGENLPQGTGFINLPSSTSQQSTGKVTYIRTRLKEGKELSEITTMEGDFVIKKALAYDVSFTTRFQGEWPRAIQAFGRNVVLGSGYSSISLATDNDYLRALGEVGILGLLSFLLIFLFIGIYIKKALQSITSPLIKSLVLGFSAGLIALGLNAILIDVFEASKVAFSLWLVTGVTFGALKLYQTKKIDYLKEIKNVAISPAALIIYIIAIVFGVYSISFKNFFVGDDFIWLKWAANCQKIIVPGGLSQCEPMKNTFLSYLANSDGFFYRPGTKMYFYLMYGFFWLSPIAYHVMSVLTHSINTILVFLISLRILKNKFFTGITALFFGILSIHSETVFWTAASGHLISAMFILLSLFLYAYASKDKYRIIYKILAFISAGLSLLFHEMGIITPFLLIAYGILFPEKPGERKWIKWDFLYLLTIPIYLYVRYLSNSHWFNGDYSYNLLKLPFNIFGNIFGYLGISLFGTGFIPFYENLRNILKINLPLAIILVVLVCLVVFLVYKYLIKKTQKDNRKIIYIGILIFVISLIPFLGLGNISLRYGYLASFGLFILVAFILKSLYFRFKSKVMLILIILFVFLFSLFNVRGLIRINSDWYNGGLISNKLLAGFNETFAKTRKATYNPVFYFVNPPIRTGDAWVFPVGLPDALWFTFQTEYLSVYTLNDLNLALDYAEGSSSARVFEFDKQGDVMEVVRTKPTPAVKK